MRKYTKKLESRKQWMEVSRLWLKKKGHHTINNEGYLRKKLIGTRAEKEQ